MPMQSNKKVGDREDLWPETLATIDMATPVSILRQQASLLAGKTAGVLEGEVKTRIDEKGNFIHDFYLVAPALDGYRYRLLTVIHPAALYPAAVYSDIYQFEADSEETLKSTLRDLLSSPRTRSLINGMVAQCQDG